MSGVAIKKPESHKREYSYLELDNGLKAVIGSDPTCDKAGAALCVNVGMCHERKDLPGLAHFLEHMLFTGTKKYPLEGDYHEFMQQNGGSANAYTTCYFTNYMFEIKPEELKGALDRFSRFFTEPLLTKTCTDREINAVDSEYQGGSTQPWWRYIGIMHQSANPDHPFHVAVGNNKVLRDEPKERGVDLYEEMVKLYNECYSANGMTLCIIGRESIAELTELTLSLFGSVVNKGVTMPIGDSVSDKPPFLPKDWNRMLLQFPVQDIKDLTFSWVIPWQDPLWRSKPTRYIGHLLGYEGAGSLCQVLKSKGLISGCSSGNGNWLEGAFSLCNVSFDLTEKGLQHLEEIGQHLFAFIGMLQKSPPERWIFDEMGKLAEIGFRFGEDQHPFDLCQEISLSLQRLPPVEVLAGKSHLYDFDPAGIASVLGKLTLEGARVQHQAKCLEPRCTERDTSYNSPMAFLPLEESWRAAWSKAVNASGSVEESTKFAASLGIALPKPNPFIPEDLSLKPLPKDPPQLPQVLPGAPPLAGLFHRQDDKLLQPKAHADFLIYTPYVCKDIESYVKAELWCRCVSEALQEYAYDAQIAGMDYSISLGPTFVRLALDGYNDKLGVLLGAVTDKMKSFTEVPDDVYSIVADAYSDEIQNVAFHSKPYSQCSMRFTELSSKGGVFPSYKRYETFKGLKRESLSGVAGEIFHSGGCHVEGLVIGNMTAEDASKLAAQLVDGLGLKTPLTELPVRAEAKLPEGKTVWQLEGTDAEEPNHAVFLRMQMEDSIETDMHLKLLNKIIGAKFFDVLRTQQQLGYIVSMSSAPTTHFQYLNAVIQTEFPPDYVRGRINAFFDEHLKNVAENLSSEEFETCRGGLLSDLKMQPKSLGEEAGRYLGQITTRAYDFGRRKRAIDYVEGSASVSSMKKFIADLEAAPRMYSQVKKTHPKEDKPLPEGATFPEDPAGLRTWTTHQETVQSFGDSAEWLHIDKSVGAAAAAAARHNFSPVSRA